jgi:hypothetical protein
MGESVLLVNSTTRPGVFGLRGDRMQDLVGDWTRLGRGLRTGAMKLDSWVGEER